MSHKHLFESGTRRRLYTSPPIKIFKTYFT